VFFKAPSLLNAGLAGAASLSLYLTAWREERENLERFGEVYRAMMGRTKRFIPFVF
jgi:protein-S-isoprenylcysteine O-methyltransferase Ste14